MFKYRKNKGYHFQYIFETDLEKSWSLHKTKLNIRKKEKELIKD